MSDLEVVEGSATPARPSGDGGEKRANYNRLVRLARLVSLLLEKVDFKISAESVGVNRAMLSRNLATKTFILSSGVEDGTCVANIIWSIDFKFKKRVIAKCSASYLITYEGIEGSTEESVNLFVDNVAKAASYAYFRALYAHLDWSANLGSPPLPILQFQPRV